MQARSHQQPQGTGSKAADTACLSLQYKPAATDNHKPSPLVTLTQRSDTHSAKITEENGWIIHTPSFLQTGLLLLQFSF
jgi:hypothetical protein